MRNKPLVLLLALLGLAAHSESWAEDYHFGQGVVVGDDFLLSGYANVVIEAPRNGPSKLAIDDLSLFVTGRINKWINPFAEAEISSATLAQQGDGPKSDGHFVPERFYNDTYLTAADTLRIGKILSPVGDWNLIHAAPLVPTITRPLTTELGFSEYASGVSWLNADPSGSRPDWQLYWQPGGEWHRRPDSVAPRHYRDVWGAHINWSLGLADKIGLSFQHGQLTTTGGRYALIGANARKTFGKWMLESEAIWSQRSGNAAQAHDHEWGYYGLVDYAFTSRWHGILEGERYQDHLVDQQSRNILLGLAYKPQAGMAWKLEYVHQTGVSQSIPTGWLASYSVLF